MRVPVGLGAIVLVTSGALAAQDGTTPLHGAFGVDLPSAYFFRGISQETAGLILQPSIDLGWTLLGERDDGAAGPLELTFGSWSSFHRGPSGSDGGADPWYESDLYFGLRGSFAERWNASVTWARFGSPSGAWVAMEEVAVAFGFDDGDLFAEGFAGLQPQVLVAVELQGQSDGGSERGVYLQVAVEPGFELGGEESGQPFTLSVPMAVGLSLDRYYEDPVTGGDTTLGFVDIGVVLSTPLRFLAGAWEANLGLHALLLGDATEAFNDGDSMQLIAAFGLSTAF